MNVARLEEVNAEACKDRNLMSEIEAKVLTVAAKDNRKCMTL